jgi:hypothetical protein
MKEEQARAPGPSDAACSPDAAELPTERAFVVQLTRGTGPGLEPFVGRVEHIASGRRLRFGDFAGFREAMTLLLCQTKQS